MNKELAKIPELSSLLRWEISKLLKPEVENLIADYLDEIPRSHINIGLLSEIEVMLPNSSAVKNPMITPE